MDAKEKKTKKLIQLISITNIFWNQNPIIVSIQLFWLFRYARIAR